MLIKITKSCNNGCTHCCNDSKPSKEHMSLSTFKDVLHFCNKNDDNLMGHELAGGEPFEHPLIWEFVKEYFEYFGKDKILTIATNGHYLAENQQLVCEYLDKYPGLFFQVTYDKRFYPKKLDTTKRIFHNKKVGLIDNLTHICPVGRAVQNKIEATDNVMSPPCYNLRIILKQLYRPTLKDFIMTLRSCNKYCIPSIQWDGYIAFGEYDHCPKHVSIYDEENKILKAIEEDDCQGCPETIELFISRFKNGDLKLKKFFEL